MTALEQKPEVYTSFMRFDKEEIDFLGNSNTRIKCLGIYYADLPKTNSSVQGGTRPVLVVSNPRNNKYSTTINVIPFTSKLDKRGLPVHVQLGEIGLLCESTLMCEQITTIPKDSLREWVGTVEKRTDILKIAIATVTQLPFLSILFV